MSLSLSSPSAQPRCAVVGSLNTDLIARAKVMPNAGETVFGSSFTVGFGGKGANQAVMFSRLGGGTNFVGAVGTDSFGRDYLEYLTRIGINTDDISREATSTGCAPIWVDETDGENRIIVVPGANMFIKPVACGAGIAKLASTSRPFAVICQNEINTDATEAALAAGAQAGALTVLTPAPVPASPLSPALLSTVSLLIPNVHEATAIAGLQAAAVEGQDSVGKARAAVKVLLERGCRAVVVTLGPKGCLVAVAGQGEPVHVPGVSVSSVVDTTGAGDAFSGSLAYFTLLLAMAGEGTTLTPGSPLLPSLDVLCEAAARACYVAAVTVTAQGTQSSYPARGDLPAVLFAAGRTGAAGEAVKERAL